MFASQSLRDLEDHSFSHFSFIFYDNLLHYIHFCNIWICRSCLNCAPIRVSLVRTEMLAVRELAVQFDGCVCCRILTSSFHDWLDFMEEMMKGATVCTISYITSSSHALARPLSLPLCLYFMCAYELAYPPTNALSRSLVSDGQLLMYVIIQW